MDLVKKHPGIFAGAAIALWLCGLLGVVIVCGVLSLGSPRPTTVTPKPAQQSKAPEQVTTPEQQAPKSPEAPKQRPEADMGPNGWIWAEQLYAVYSSDAVRWRDQYAERYVTVALDHQAQIDARRDKYFVVISVTQGGGGRGVAVPLREADARRLSRINQGQEKVPNGTRLCLRAVVDDGFHFSDGHLVFLAHPTR